ncbi:hypothetical protein [Xenorhabdus entomophaga]|uniref:hypothetical protein n=1 Tax=Xenorhabdus entomophaga TaxID=3136257 RepID=UPI0030F385EE
MGDKEVLMQEIRQVLVNSPAMAEEKLAVMMFSFQLLLPTQADMSNMRFSDGRALTLKLEHKNLRH